MKKKELINSKQNLPIIKVYLNLETVKVKSKKLFNSMNNGIILTL